MVNSVIDRRVQRAGTVLDLHLGILEHRESLGQQRQYDVIFHVTWRVAARPERRDSHHRPQHSASVGLAGRTNSSLHLRAIITPV